MNPTPALTHGIWIGLGANLGDAESTLRAALASLATLPSTVLRRHSRFYRTAPVDAGGPDYVNAVAELASALTPLALLDALQSLEQAHGRARPYRNAPRTLDLDLLLWGEQSLTSPRLTLPHPRLHERAFVLVPLAELATETPIPGLGTVQDWLSTVREQRIAPI